MKNFVIFALAVSASLSFHFSLRADSPENEPAARGGRVLIMFWNVENFFDWHDSGENESDAEFSSFGQRRWTRSRFYRKCHLVGKTIFHIASLEGNLPDVVCFAEVENRGVLEALTRETLLRKCRYEAVCFPSRDPRGIDTGLIYRKDALRLVSSRPAGVFGPDGERILTRDILICQFVTSGGDSLAVTVNHHPSKYGGEASAPRREAAMKALRDAGDSLRLSGWSEQVHIGDFNDTPDASQFRMLEEDYADLATPLFSAGEGSIRFDGEWELIDLAFVARGAFRKAEMKVVRPPFLTAPDAVHSGTKPLRTYSGPRYIGGASDHYPVLVCVDL